MTDRKVTLQLDDGSAPIELPVLEPTVGNPVIDIASLTRYGYFTYDPGFVSTAACESAITYIDGEAGVLLHRPPRAVLPAAVRGVAEPGSKGRLHPLDSRQGGG